MNTKTVILVVGPTAVGKTAVSLRLAKQFQTSIISADSRQCYKELNIGVAKPSPAELQEVKHYFINSHSIHEEVHASLFEKYSLQCAAELFKERDMVIMVGGTGLYIKAFCEGMDDIPPVDEEIRAQVQQEYALHGLGWLQDQIKIQDPLFYQKGEIRNPQRLMRAMEVTRSTGLSILSFRSRPKAVRPFRILKYGISLDKATLYARIDRRVDQMFETGLEEEARSLLPQRRLNALQTVGYSELFDFFDGKYDLPAASALIKKNTRHYAKRQMTWFRKDPSIQWVSGDFPDGLKI
jgi:tRNA dimethylallyltransferase